MSAADVTVGFFGKMPAAGDFVTRRLPHEFVRNWDHWLSRHIVPLIGAATWDEDIALRFLSGSSVFGAAAVGIVVSSRDRIGRRFPLSVVALPPLARIDLVTGADPWLARIEAIAMEARDGELTPDRLDAMLAALPVPVSGDGEVVDGMAVWTGHCDVRDIEVEQPAPVLRQILAPRREAIGQGAQCS